MKRRIRKLTPIERQYKRLCLTICRQLWRWLAEHTDKQKIDWPGWTQVQAMVGTCSGHCPMCQYVCTVADTCHTDIPEKDGMECPLVGHGVWTAHGCLQSGSAYCNWEHGIARRSNARRIAKACTSALIEMGNEDIYGDARPEVHVVVV